MKRAYALTVVCPKCRAKPNERCVGFKGNPLAVRIACHLERHQEYAAERRSARVRDLS